jgi:hypothetical protein
VSVPLRGAKRSKASVPAAGAELFTYEARRDGRPVARLRGVTTENGGVTIEAEVFPVSRPPSKGGIARPFTFPSEDAATKFVDDALIALEYLNCEIVS